MRRTRDDIFIDIIGKLISNLTQSLKSLSIRPTASEISFGERDGFFGSDRLCERFLLKKLFEIS
jgi:hypothetical protein